MKPFVKSILKWGYYLPSNIINTMLYIFHHVNVGRAHETKGIVHISNRGTISIGHHVRIISNWYINPISSARATSLKVKKNAKLIIGNHTRMSNCMIVAANKIEIGDYVRLGAGVRVFDTDFHSLDPFERTSTPERGTPTTKPVSILDYAFIGTEAVILKGVTVGKYSVIGAGAIVTKDVPDGEIWAGNPARKIGQVPMDG